MSRICRLQFVNATFKVGPSTPAQGTTNLLLDVCLQSATWLLCFYMLLLAGLHTFCPKADTHKSLEHSKIRNYRWRAGSLHRDSHTRLVGHEWWLAGIHFIWVHTVFYFRKILLIQPLRVVFLPTCGIILALYPLLTEISGSLAAKCCTVCHLVANSVFCLVVHTQFLELFSQKHETGLMRVLRESKESQMSCFNTVYRGDKVHLTVHVRM